MVGGRVDEVANNITMPDSGYRIGPDWAAGRVGFEVSPDELPEDQPLWPEVDGLAAFAVFETRDGQGYCDDAGPFAVDF